ncbi:FMN-binding protein [Tissierella sp.]|uniref:FMN-binding protein n=1 Tax=Tissierella sp. TaxID=41274 RepID=UPI00286521D3|nr:FMN-binding protein [Tissierella sp.]MDR7857067.1 FMN-binding protein [Tissierella sp.]
MKSKFLVLALVLVLAAAVFTGCTKEAAKPAPVDESKPGAVTDVAKGDLVDGTYLVKTEVSDHANFSMATLVVKDGQVSSLNYNEYLAGSGEAKNESNYPYADGIAVIKDLNAQFNEKKDLNAVDFDAVSGATSTKGTFKEITTSLLEKAEKGEAYTPVYKDGTYEAKAKEASHGWLAQVAVKVQDGQIVGVDYVELAVEESEGVKVGDAKTAENYSYAAPFEVVPAVQKLIIDNNGTENLNVDGIAGATNTRDGMLELVNEALSTAK